MKFKLIHQSLIICFQGTEFSNLNDICAMDLPFMFTIETEKGVNIMKTKNSLERLYQKVFPECKSNLCYI